MTTNITCTHKNTRRQHILDLMINGEYKQPVAHIKHNKELADFVNEQTPLLSDNCYTFATKLHWVINQLTDFPICTACGAKITRNVYTVNLGYVQSPKAKLSCGSAKCRAVLYKESYKATCQEKYGVDNVYQANHVKAKIKTTMLKRHGVEHPSQSEAIQAKKQQTSLANFGVEYPFQSDEIKEKVKATCLAKYGVTSYLASDDCKEKTTQTMLDRYGVEHYSQTDEFTKKVNTTNRRKYGFDWYLASGDCKEKTTQTMLDRYGVEHFMETEEFKTKSKQTCLEKYGVKHAAQAEQTKRANRLTCKQRYGASSYVQSATHKTKSAKRRYKQLIAADNIIRPEFSEQTFVNYTLANRTDDLWWRCSLHPAEIISSPIYKTWYQRYKEFARCPICYPYQDAGTSDLEKAVQQYVIDAASCNSGVQVNTKTVIAPLELDIYIADKQLAIEFDGLYWHSEAVKPDQNYHLNKTERCEEQDIHLIHIFENEWLYKQDIVKSRLRNLLGVYDKNIGARKCSVKPVLAKDAYSFLETCHIQGAVHSKVNLGLYYENTLVSLMTFSKPRFSKTYDWELVRFCNKLGYSIPGAASKLLKQFERLYNPTSLVSYADRRWSYSKNNVYKTLGFELSHASAPNYWYWKDDEFSSRVKYQKHKLANLLETFDPNKTEAVNMLANGFNRIYDCGNLVYNKIYVCDEVS